MTPSFFDSGAICVDVGAEFVDCGRFPLDFPIGASPPLSMGQLTHSQLSIPLTLMLSVDIASHAHDPSTCVAEALGIGGKVLQLWSMLNFRFSVSKTVFQIE